MRRVLFVLSIVLGLVWVTLPAAAQTCAWSAIGAPIPGASFTVHALTVIDAAAGPTLSGLYAGGISNYFPGVVGPNALAKWNGTAWSPVGSGIDLAGSIGVSALTVFDDGTGPALYAGGNFTTAGGVLVNHIAKWDGTQWSALGSGVGPVASSQVLALTVFDDGTGEALYAGGNFTTAGGVPVSHVAKWDGTQWSAVGSGANGFSLALTVFDDAVFPLPPRPALYAGGFWGAPFFSVAKWNGMQWSAVGGGTANQVHALTVFDDGTGPALYAAGHFGAIAKWNGTQWSTVGSGINGDVWALTAFDDVTGSGLYVGGGFTTIGGVAANSIAKWDGTDWSALGTGQANVFALAVDEAVIPPALYVGGAFGPGVSFSAAVWRCM